MLNHLKPLVDILKLGKPFSSTNCICIGDSQAGNRAENQDNFLFIRPKVSELAKATYYKDQAKETIELNNWESACHRLVVADGMGGHAHGREIAELAIEEFLKFKPLFNPLELRSKLYEIHDKLLKSFSLNEKHNKKPGTTLLLVDINQKGKAIIATVGDSRAYRWRNKKWELLTFDHTSAEFNWRDGDIPDEDYNPKKKNHRLTQALGYGSVGIISDKYDYKPRQLNSKLRLDLAEDLSEKAKKHADIFNFNMIEGEAILLLTDGLFSASDNKEPLKIPSPNELSDQVKLRRYLFNVIKNGSQDNVTAVLLWNGNESSSIKK